MRITRRGAGADHGPKTIEFPDPTFEWRKRDSCLTIRQRSVGDFSTKSRHSYTIEFTSEEICKLLQAVAAAGPDAHADLERALETGLRPMLQLVHVVSGNYRIAQKP